MRLKLTLHRTNGEPADVAVTVTAATTVGELATALADRDPAARSRASGPLTLLAHDQAGRQRAFAAGQAVERSGLRSGSAVTVTAVGRHFAEYDAGTAAGLLRVLDGPDRGREYPLRAGTNVVGRDPASDVCLTDPLVSKRHARIIVADVVEIVDSDSSNGVEIGGGRVGRARLGPADAAVLGDTTIAVAVHGNTGGRRGTVAFNRSPRLDAPHAGVEREAPAPPNPPGRRRFPFLSMLAPLLLGAVLYLITGSLLSLTFVALSPLMLLGTYSEDGLTSRRDHRDAVAAFRAELATFNATLHAAADTERAARQASHPSTVDLVRAAAGLDTLLWTRRPEHASFLDLRLGLGPQPSYDTVVTNGRTAQTARLYAPVDELVAAYRVIPDVPVVCRLTECGSLGIAGPRAEAVPLAWGLVAQLVILHSPAELVLTAVMSSASAKQWQWLRWLPHTNPPPASTHTPLAAPHLTTGGAGALALVGALEELIATRAAERSGPASGPVLPAVIVLVEDDTEVDRSRLVDLAERGPAHGVHLLWVAAAVPLLPAACRAFLAVDPARPGVAHAGFVRGGDAVHDVRPEPLDQSTVEQLARALAAVTDAGARVDAETDLPRTTSFVGLAGAAVDRSVEAVLDRWQVSGSLPGSHPDPHREPSLRALVGATGVDEPFHLDLRVHGPHALVGGTTGAGKSELLQSWVLGMASAYSPHRVTFLFVDYKGGSAFGACQDLPHCVGLVTDLDPHLVHRALTSLRAELTHREHVLNTSGAKDLAELEQNDPDGAPPRLVIVVDEFAALKKEIPEFVDGVVDIAQRGRSLGLHLILATQRPAGVITENLRANTNLRVALRMADEADSTDVLGVPVAAGFDPSIPGRAVAKTGPGRLVTFQAAYAGGWSDAVVETSTVDVETLAFGIGQPWPEPKPTVRPVRPDPGPNDIRRVVTTIGAAAAGARVPAPRLPWLPSLPPVIDLRTLAAGGTALVLGCRDLPASQAQPAALFNPDRDGNLVVYGTGGTGKSTLLRTVVLAALTGSAGPFHAYGIEFGTRGLAALEPLPQVGAIVRGEEDDRVARLLAMLRREIDDRAQRFARARAATMEEYRRSTGDDRMARVLLVVDGMAAFSQQFQPGSLAGVYEQLLTVATDGRPVGVHVAVSADRPGAVSGGLVSALQCRIVLRLAGAEDYGTLGLRPDALPADAPAGRGLFGGDEFQAAVHGGADSAAQHNAIQALAAAYRGDPAPAVRSLPDRVELDALPSTVDGLPAFAIDKARVWPVGFRPSGYLMVTGPAGSGRTTAVLTLVAATRRAAPGTAAHLLSASFGSSLARRPGWTGTAGGVDDVARAAGDLATDLRGAPPSIVVVEGIADFAYTAADSPLQDLLKIAQDAGHLVIAEGEIGQLTRGGPLVDLVRTARTGLVLQPQSHEGMVLQADFPKGLRLADFPPGRGLHVVRGAPSVVQVAIDPTAS